MAATGTMREETKAGGEGAAAPGRLYGVIDVLRANKIAGWAIDRADAGATLDVEILRDGRAIARVRADRPRRDLEANGLGTGRYGFSAAIDPPIEAGFEFTLTAVARAPDGETAPLRRVGAAAEPEDPLRRLVERLHVRLGEFGPREEPVRLQDVVRIEDLLARLEVAQARIERALEQSPPGSVAGRGLKMLVALSLAVGFGSLFVGLVSLLRP